MKILIMVMVFCLGFFSSHYKLPPYHQIKLIKSIISPYKVTDSSGYNDRKSLFESLNTRADVVMVGDSMTFGAEWSEMFSGLVIVNRGIGGDTSKGVLNRIDSIISTRASKALVMIGFNDLSNNVSISDIYLNYVKIAQTLKSAGITPYIQSTMLTSRDMAGVNKSIITLNKKLELFAYNEGMTYVDINEGLAIKGALNDVYTSDGVHLNGRGYLVWRGILSKHIY